MKTKTVRYPAGLYRIYAGSLEYWCPVGLDKFDNDIWGWVDTGLKIGTEAVLVSKTDINSNATEYHLRIAPNGIGGNSNPAITRFHGWRGTMNDISIQAHGARRITKMRPLRSGDVAVTVGADIYPDKP